MASVIRSTIVLSCLTIAMALLAINAARADQYGGKSSNTTTTSNNNKNKNHTVDLKAVVSGQVYCDLCRNGKIKKPLQGVTVGVFCWNGMKELEFYGKTNEDGKFKIELCGFDYEHWGGKACAAKLISANYSTPCTQAMDLHHGLKAAPLHIKSKSTHLVSLQVGPFAYTSPTSSLAPECCKSPPSSTPTKSPPSITPIDHHHHVYPPPYHYKSPPPPPPY